MLSGDRNADQLGNATRAQAFKDLATPTPDLYEMTPGQKIGAQAVGFALGAESIAVVANFGVTEGPLVAKRFSGLEFDVEGPLSRNPFASFENAASEFEAASVPPAPVLPPVAASGPYIELGSQEAIAAQRAYAQTFNSQGTLVIGRLEDTAVGADIGMTRLNEPNWTINVNDAWIQGGIDAQHPFYLGSPIKMSTLRSGDPIFPTTVYFRELQQLRAAGYYREGEFMLPPRGN